jgi:glycerophosphoryl diester phosphodiesterase
VRILAHRGSPTSGTFENTVPAIAAALATGADGVEVDLRLTADGVLAVCHDPDLGRLTGRPLPVHDTGWAELREAAAARGVALARVEWVLAAAAGRPVVLELKPAPAEAAQVLVDRLGALNAAGLPLAVTVSSFDPALARAFRAAAPRHLRARTALLGRPGCLPLAVLRQALEDGHDQVHPHIGDLMEHPEVVATAASCGAAVVPWTVNSRRALRRCAQLGVAAVITDVPQSARLALGVRAAAA